MVNKEIDYSTMTISRLAREIERDWKKVNFAAKPYLRAMYELSTVNDNYGADSGESVVVYFLANASTWRGSVARAIKAELKRRVA